jgi:hypothetical protein
MKRYLFCLMILALTAALGLAPAQGQDLAQLAKKTREERMKVKQQHSVRIWNNDNMPKRPAGEGPTAAAGMSFLPPAVSPSAVVTEPSADASDTSAIDTLRDHIKQARQSLKGKQERLSLAEDELNLLQVQQASELAPETQTELVARIKDKNAAISDLHQDIDKTKKDIEGLEKDLKAQGGTLEEKKK